MKKMLLSPWTYVAIFFVYTVGTIVVTLPRNPNLAMAQAASCDPFSNPVENPSDTLIDQASAWALEDHLWVDETGHMQIRSSSRYPGATGQQGSVYYFNQASGETAVISLVIADVPAHDTVRFSQWRAGMGDPSMDVVLYGFADEAWVEVATLFDSFDAPNLCWHQVETTVAVGTSYPAYKIEQRCSYSGNFGCAFTGYFFAVETAVVSPTATATETAVYLPTVTASPTDTPTVTPTPTITMTPGPTITPTATVPPTATPTPQPGLNTWNGQTEIPVMGAELYEGFEGGLYPGGVNELSGAYLDEVTAALTALPECPKVAALGMSNMRHITDELIDRLAAAGSCVTVYNMGQSGAAQPRWESQSQFDLVKKRAGGVNGASIDAVLYFNAWPFFMGADGSTVQEHVPMVADSFEATYGLIQSNFPNAKIVFWTSREFAGFAESLNPEPYAHAEGFAVKEMIRRRIDGEVSGPPIVWGPYQWEAEWQNHPEYFSDGVHLSDEGLAVMGQVWFEFYTAVFDN